MITLGTGDYIAGVASVASKLAITIVGGLELGTAEDYKTLFNGFLPNAAASQYAAPASKSALIRSITVVNTDSSSRTFQLFRGGTTAQFAITGTVTLPAGYFAIWDGSGFAVFSDQGQRLGVGAAGAAGTSDHGALTGLADDDHPQYATDTDLTTHAGAADPHTGYRLESATIGTADLTNDGVTYAKMQNVSATDRILGRDTTGAGDVEELTVAQVMAMNPAPTVNVYVASDTWTKLAAARFVRVRVVGCGGGSGGCATTGSGQRAVSGGGGGGGYAEKVFAASALGSSETITVGAAGLAGTAGDNDGGTGGTCSFGVSGTLVQATGGGGGEGAATVGAPGTPNLGGAGGVGSGGDLNAYGSDGGNGGQPGAAGQSAAGGYGGGTALGGGRRGSGQPEAALAGRVYGGGAAGGTIVASTTQIAGAAGALGVVIVETYY